MSDNNILSRDYILSPPVNPALERLLRPRSIAVVGGGEWCASVIEQCRQLQFPGKLFAVHPTRDHVAGVRAWPTVSELPEAPDATFIGVNRQATLSVIAQLAAREGERGAVCFANGFAEAGEHELQHELLAAAGDTALLGPNCYGFINALDGVALWPDQHGCRRVDRGVAIITQSSNIALNLSMQQRGLPIAYIVTSGNQAQQGFADIGMALLQDPRVSALGLHVESFGDIAAFERLIATASALKKGVVVLKTGRSPQAQRATLSHTASIAGTDAGADALLRRVGVARVNSLPVLLETLTLLHVHGAFLASAGHSPAPRCLRLASLSCSGGEAALIADAALSIAGPDSELPITFPVPEKAAVHVLTAALGPRVTLANPLDYDTGIWHDQAALQRVYAAMSGPGIDLSLLVLDLPHPERCDSHDWDRPIQAVIDAATETDRRFAVVTSLPENLPEPLATQLINAGVAPLCGLDDALAAAVALAGVQWRANQPDYRPVLQRPAYGKSTPTALSEHAAKAVLAHYGVQVPQREQASNLTRVAEAATRIGFPVVVKGEGLSHKSDAGAVALYLSSAQAAVDAAAGMPCESFIVEACLDGGVAELLVGVVHDPSHGFVLTLAAGGVLTEILQDRCSLLLPVTADELSEAIAKLRVARILSGARGGEAASMESLRATILAVQASVLAHADAILELEINPLLCTTDAAIALDALITCRARSQSTFAGLLPSASHPTAH